MTWSIQEALTWLDEHQNFESVGEFRGEPTLDSVRVALSALGISPQEFLTIHITGTNGKGSTSYIATELLVGLGHKVGTFTSPHLHRVNERIRLNGEPVSDALLADELLLVSGLEKTLGITLSWFEILTVTAIALFYAEGVDTLVLEVGIGGTWDSTNAMDGDVAVITNVAKDHLEVLGPTLRDVARNKAGIIKANSISLVGILDSDLVEVIEKSAGTDFLWLGKDIVVSEVYQAVGGWKFDLRTRRSIFSDLYLSLYGRFQVDNAALAIAAVEELIKKSLSGDFLSEILSRIAIPGRAEIAHYSPLVILDVAHNPAGARALCQLIDLEFAGYEPRICVVSLLKHKDSKEFFGELRGTFDTIVLSLGTYDRFTPTEELEVIAKKLDFDLRTAPSIEASVALGIKLAGENGLVVITGSFRVVGPARAFLNS